MKVEYLYPTQGTHKERFEILQRQWRTHLGIELIPSPEGTIGLESGNLQSPIPWDCGLGGYRLIPGPNLLPRSVSDRRPANVTGWTDYRYDAAMAEAKSCTEPALRLRKLAECERMLLEAMPVIPLYFEAWQQLRKPYVRGIEGNSIDAIAFHRAWIDTNWRPS